MGGTMASRRVGHEVSAPFDAAPEAAPGGVLPLPIASQLPDGSAMLSQTFACPLQVVRVLLVLLVLLVLQVLASRHRS